MYGSSVHGPVTLTLTRPNLVEKLLEKAETKLRASRELYMKGFYEDSVSRSYYAMFHAARAALTNIHVTATTHEAVVLEFGNRFLENVFPRQLAKSLAGSKMAYETYEYSATAEITREEAGTILKEAETFVAAISSRLKGEGTLMRPAKSSKRYRHQK